MVSGWALRFVCLGQYSQRGEDALLPLEHGDAAQSEKENVQHQRHANETRDEDRNKRAGHDDNPLFPPQQFGSTVQFGVWTIGPRIVILEESGSGSGSGRCERLPACSGRQGLLDAKSLNSVPRYLPGNMGRFTKPG